MSYNALNHNKQGGAETEIGGALNVVSGGSVTVESGGSIAVESGGAIDIESGGLFKVGGTTVLPTNVIAGKTTSAADSLAIPVTHTLVEKTTGADAEALTLADGKPGQILTIVLKTDGGGDGTLTPAKKSGYTSIVFADAGDTATLMFVDSTVGWVLLAVYGLTAQPVVNA